MGLSSLDFRLRKKLLQHPYMLLLSLLMKSGLRRSRATSMLLERVVLRSPAPNQFILTCFFEVVDYMKYLKKAMSPLARAKKKSAPKSYEVPW